MVKLVLKGIFKSSTKSNSFLPSTFSNSPLKFTFLTSLITALALSVGISGQALAMSSKKKADLKDLQALQAILEDPSKPAIFGPSDPKWSPAALSLPTGAELTVLEGDPNQPGPFIMRIRLPANYKIPAHWNLADEHLTVISGTLHLGLGDNLDMRKAKKLPAGSFARIPAKMHHYGWVKEETVVQYHGIGPWGIEYINPADNPNPGIQQSTGIQQATGIQQSQSNSQPNIIEVEDRGN